MIFGEDDAPATAAPPEGDEPTPPPPPAGKSRAKLKVIK